jgi:hypothetical protein
VSSEGTQVVFGKGFNELKYIGAFKIKIFSCYNCNSMQSSVFSEVKYV